MQKYPNTKDYGGYEYEGFIQVVDKAVDATWPKAVNNNTQFALSRGTEVFEWNMSLIQQYSKKKLTMFPNLQIVSPHMAILAGLKDE